MADLATTTAGAGVPAPAAVITTDNRVGPAHSIPATKDNKPAPGEIVAYPRDIDVVGTRRRTWSHHPGNVYYRELVTKTLAEILEKAGETPMRVWAIKIVDHMTERDAVFLKADEQNGQWHVMDYAASVNKSAVALRNAEIKQRGPKAGGPKAGGGAKKKGGSKKKSLDGAGSAAVATVSAGVVTPHTQDLPPIKYVEGPVPEKKIYLCVYEAKQKPTVPLDPYCMTIVNLMCRQTNAKAAASVLDIPVTAIYKTAEEEPDKQRLIRLQLRQRYIAAMTIGMSPVVFSKKLMELWGGSITARHVRVDKDGNVMEVQPPLPTPGVPVPGAPITAAPPVASTSTISTPVMNKDAIPAAAADKPTGGPSSAELLVAYTSKGMSTLPHNVHLGVAPPGIQQPQVAVDAVMTDATEKAVSAPSAQPFPEGCMPTAEVEKPAQGTVDVVMQGEDTATVAVAESTDKEVKIEAQLETEKSQAVATSSPVDPVPVTVPPKEQSTIDIVSAPTQVQAPLVAVSTTEDAAESKEIKAESIVEPASKEETSTTTKEAKPESLADATIGVTEESDKVETDEKPEVAIASVEAQDEIKVEADAVAQEETENAQEAAKADESMKLDEVKAEESVKEETEEKQTVADEPSAAIKEELLTDAVAKESGDNAEPIPEMDEAKEDPSPKEEQDVKEGSVEEKSTPPAAEEKEGEKETDEEPAVKSEEIDATEETTVDPVKEEEKVKEEETEAQRPRSNSRTRRKKSDADANEKPVSEIESPRASRRRRKLAVEAMPQSPVKARAEEGGSPRSPGKRNKRRKR